MRLSSVDSRALAAGVTWALVIANAPWVGRAFHTSVVDAAGAIYVLGGRDGSGRIRIIYARPDGFCGVVWGVVVVGTPGGYYWGITGE